MAQKLEVKLSGYLKATKLDRHGAKHATFEFSSKDAVEIAKLELMSRDLVDRLPILLSLTITQECQNSAEKGSKTESTKKKTRGKGSFSG
jgi:hypothetical protein